MGFARKRVLASGVRYTATYLDARGKQCSAGTFSSKRQADKAWQHAEAKLAEGRLGDPARGRQTFLTYLEEIWLPNHQMEASTRESYTYSLYNTSFPSSAPGRWPRSFPNTSGPGSQRSKRRESHQERSNTTRRS
jgi:hypothetical protein